MQYVLVQKGQLTQWTLQIWVVGTITFSAIRSLYPHTVDAVGAQYTVDVSAKRSIQPVDLANMGGGEH